MKVAQSDCRTPSCRGCGRHLGFEHHAHCVLAPIEARSGETRCNARLDPKDESGK